MFEFHVNMSQIHKWQVTSDNVYWYDVIMRNKGSFLTINPKGYDNYLCEFGIFYTKTH